jgi:2-polyprenyl-3-methyl-5-hydroxy-6-metoxy-1,4-benzoquinol methylase
VVDRKWWVTALRECAQCFLLFRTPTTSTAENRKFYEYAYRQGFTTELPTLADLQELKRTLFKGTEKDYSAILSLLASLGLRAGDRVFDFGCSWGYGSWQLRQAGYDVASYEISALRARYAAEHLGVHLSDVSAEPAGTYDAFFSSHVIEHVPNPREMVENGMRLLRPGGLFVALTPNGTHAFRKANPAAWSKLWGQVHPQLITERWINQVAANRAWLVTATPPDPNALEAWKGSKRVAGQLVGPELLFVIRA